MKKAIFTTIFCASCCLSTASIGAALCVQVTGISPQCLYDDASSCQHEAARMGGTCALNPASPPTMASSLNSLYCVVESNMIKTCTYPDRATCDLEAAHRQGACVANLPEPYAEDPFKIKRPYY